MQLESGYTHVRDYVILRRCSQFNTRHGLHISGESPGDDVLRYFEGGYGGDYVWDMPSDHMGGTYWYHSHHHGATTLHVGGGAFGMIVVDSSKDRVPINVQAMPERIAVIGFIDTSVKGYGGDKVVQGNIGDSGIYTFNGVQNANVCMPMNEWQHFRILFASHKGTSSDVQVAGAGCQVYLLARDGVWRTKAPKELHPKDASSDVKKGIRMTGQ